MADYYLLRGFNMKNLKRIFSIIIATVMIITVIPTITFSAGATGTYTTPSGYNENDYQKAIAFLSQTKAINHWDLEDPETWIPFYTENATFDPSTGDNIRLGYSIASIIWNDSSPKRITSFCYNGLDIPDSYLDLSGFTALEWLDCNDNKLTALDVSGCIALSYLDCSKNQITEFDVSSCTALKYLHCVENTLTSLDISKNVLLEELYCQINQLTELDVSEHTSLINLTCWENQLSSLNVTGCTTLKWIDCTKNMLTELGLSSCTELDDLSCWGNQLTELNILNNPNLTYLNCDDNQLTELDVTNNSALTFLWCEKNQLTELNISNNPNLNNLNCSENQFITLDVSNNHALAFLYCYANQLTILDVSNLNLIDLSCFQNKIIELDVSKSTALKRLLCDYNQLTELDISNNPALNELMFNGNSIAEIDLSNNPLLEWVQCQFNGITELDVSANPLLRILIASYNELTNISSIASLENLNYVSINGNFIDLKDQNIITLIDKIKATVENNNGEFYYSPQGRVLGTGAIEDIKKGKVTINLKLLNGLVISIDPDKITSSARETDLNIEIEVTNTGNQIDGIPANSIVIRPVEHGAFGFEISFIVTTEQLSEAGLNGNSAKLFHIDENGKAIEDGRFTRNADGSVTIAINHASYYVLSEEKPVINSNTSNPSGNSNTNTINNSGSTGGSSNATISAPTISTKTQADGTKITTTTTTASDGTVIKTETATRKGSKNQIVIETKTKGKTVTTAVNISIKDIKASINTKTGLSTIEIDISADVLKAKSILNKRTADIKVVLDDNALLSRINNSKVKNLRIDITGGYNSGVSDIIINKTIIEQARKLGKNIYILVLDSKGKQIAKFTVNADSKTKVIDLNVSVSVTSISKIAELLEKLNGQKGIELTLSSVNLSSAKKQIDLSGFGAKGEQTVYVYKVNSKGELTLIGQTKLNSSGVLTFNSGGIGKYIIVTKKI